VDCQRLQPLESTLPRMTEMLAHRAFRVRRGRERFVLYFEFYTYWDRDEAIAEVLGRPAAVVRRKRIALGFV
jgi:hypothetical protein